MEPKTVEFTDLETGSDAQLIVRRADGSLALGFTVEANGDLDLSVSPSDARRLAEAIIAAIE